MDIVIDGYRLAMSEAARAAIEAGQAYRQGGVVYTMQGKIFEHLHDAGLIENQSSSVHALLGASVVPVAVLAVSLTAINHRLGKIEAEIRNLNAKLKEMLSELHILNFKADAQLLGRLNGLIHAAQININESKSDRLTALRDGALAIYHQLRSFVLDMAHKASQIKNHCDVLHQYSKAMFIAGFVARDLSYRIDERETAQSLSEMLEVQAAELKELVYSVLDSVDALFWRQTHHVNFAVEVKESYDRLSSHTQLLRQLSDEDIEKIISNQIDV